MRPVLIFNATQLRHCRLETNFNMLNFLKTILRGQNQFASGGLVLMLVGGIAAYLRSIPLALWEWLVEQTTMLITVKDDDVAFVWVKEWFLEQEFLKRVRRVDLDTTLRSSNLALAPGPGRHWFWYGGRPFRVTFYRSEDTKGRAQRRTETLYLQTIGRRQAFLGKMVEEIVECHRKKSRLKSSLFVHDDYWNEVEGYMPRLLDSVILHAGEKERVVEDVQKFRASKARYRHLGIPYHRGYLFYGPPGTGKTSLASAIADRFAMSIYAMNLTQFNDRSLMRAVNDVPQHSMILFEDIDCMRSGQARNPKTPLQKTSLSEKQGDAPDDKREDKAGDKPEDKLGVTLSGLLNVLDGFYAPENVLFVMTSNQIEALDPALLRPGRIDYRLYLGKATAQQKVELYRRFFATASEYEAIAFVEDHPWAQTMAEFQGLLLGFEEKREKRQAKDRQPGELVVR